MLQHVVDAMDTIRKLPRYAHDGQTELPPVVRVACLESFFMNVRLLAEFFAKRTRQEDFGAAELAPNLSLTAEEKGRLERWMDIASKHVAHFSRQRLAPTPQDVDYEDTSLAGLEAIVGEFEPVWARFEQYAGIDVHPARLYRGGVVTAAAGDTGDGETR